MWTMCTVNIPAGSPRTLRSATNEPPRSVTCTRPLMWLEVGVGVVAVGDGVAGAMKGTGVGAIDVPTVGAHAASTIVIDTPAKGRRTRVATGWRYAEMECPEAVGDWIKGGEYRRICGRLLLGCRGGISGNPWCNRNHRRLYRRHRGVSDVQAGLHRSDRARGSGAGRIRPRESLLRVIARYLLADPRSNDQQPAGLGFRHPISLGHLFQ